jgi:sarcosine oxidase subunit beta
VICAAGPWSPRLVGTAGLDLPVEHVLSPVFPLELDRPLPYTLPAIKSHESSVGLHRKRDDAVFVTYTPGENEGASRYDPGTVGDAAPDEFRRTALRWAERLVPRLGDADLGDEWVGVGTATPDGNPLVGWSAVEGLSLAVTMSGIQLAPAVGSIVARQLVEGEPTEYYDSVSVSRFDGHADRRTRGEPD